MLYKLNVYSDFVMKKLLLIIFLFFTLPIFALEELHFDGFIADNAKIISAQNKEELNGILYSLQAKTGADIAVVTMKSLEGEPIEDASLEIGRKYALGDKKLNNGALVFVVLDDRRARIEIGYGLEGFITDAKAGRILDNYMIPYFKIGDYETGTIQGALALAYEIAKAYGVELSFEKPISPEKEDDTDILFITILFILLMFLSGGGPGGLIFLPFGNFRGGGGSGIKFGGGGGFGGGGSSRGW